MGCHDPETKSGRKTLLGVVSGERQRNRPVFEWVGFYNPVRSHI